MELRRLRVCNKSNRLRQIEVTSYLEIALNDPNADAAHPAFSKLFVETKLNPELNALIAIRRPRANDETWPCAFHALLGVQPESWETDRARFLGRGRHPGNPEALAESAQLSGTVGAVLDPIFSLRTVFSLEVGASAEATFIAGLAESIEVVQSMGKRL
jgi:cyclic beta-1,2-glucan synthetase